MLSKKLRELEANLLIKRTKSESVLVKVEYFITDHGESLYNVVIRLQRWGPKT